MTRRRTTEMTCFPSFRGASPCLDAAAHHWNNFFFLFPGYAPPPPRLRCRSAPYTPKTYFRAPSPRQKGAPPGALLSGRRQTIVLAAFTAVLQMSCRHLFFLTDPLSCLFPLLRHRPPLLGHSVHLIFPILPFPLSHQRISGNHRCMWLYR